VVAVGSILLQLPVQSEAQKFIQRRKTMSRLSVQSGIVLQVLSAMLLSAGVAAAAIPELCNTGHKVAESCGALVAPDNGTTTDANWQIAVPYPSAPSSSPITDSDVLPKRAPAWVETPFTPL